MDFPRPFLAIFCLVSASSYSRHLTVENVASALGFVVFAINECAKFYALVRRKIKARSLRSRKRRLRVVSPPHLEQ
jgi:hypothetical protein